MTDNRTIDRVTYDDRLLEITGLDRAKLPDLVPPGTIVGELTAEAAAPTSGCPAGLPVAAGSGDVHSAVFGSGAVADFDAHLYIGTSSWISGHVPFKKTAPTSNVASIPAALAGKYMIVDEHETAGACLTFLRDNLGFAADFEAMNAMVDAVGAGQRPGAVHPVAQRRAVPGRRPHHPGRVPQPLAVHHPGPDGPGRLRGGGLQLAVAARRRSRSSPAAGSTRWPSSGVGPTPTSGPRSTPTCWAGRSARWPTRCWPTCVAPP